ncbi:MAG: leucyl/phenylalanyl-tRNA--protein transferase [Gammaproteobacteria bacterium]
MKATRQPAFIAPGSAPVFPPDETALDEPNGLIAIGGDLTPARLLAAYRRGIFPWYESGQPLLWWTPDPRLILLPQHLHVGRTLRRALRHGGFEIRFDTNFDAVIRACAAPRRDENGTWITPEMIAAYAALHQQAFAHSVEVWRDKELIGGLYGIALGTAFFGESMFSRESDASKLALHALCQRLQPWPNAFIDCQIPSRHLLGLGAELVPRPAFAVMRIAGVDTPGPWDTHLP